MIDQKLYNQIKKDIYDNEKHPLAVQKLLVVKGMSEEEAIKVVSYVRTQERNKLIKDAKKNMIIGGVMVDGGIALLMYINSGRVRSKGLFITSLTTIGAGIVLFGKGYKYSQKKVEE